MAAVTCVLKKKLPSPYASVLYHISKYNMWRNTKLSLFICTNDYSEGCVYLA